MAEVARAEVARAGSRRRTVPATGLEARASAMTVGPASAGRGPGGAGPISYSTWTAVRSM
jgi:hypothetical protein